MINRLNHKRSEPLLFLLLLLASTFFSACQEQMVYHRFHALATNGWQRKDTLCFNVATTDSQTQYRLSVDVRNRNTYPFQNLLLGLSVIGPDSVCTTLADTLSLSLADAQGMWTGKGWGGLYQSRFPIGPIAISKAGNYQIRLHQVMPIDSLIGINDLGVLLEKNK